MRHSAIIGLLMAVALAGPLAAGEKKAAPKLTQEARDGLQISQENIIRLKLKAVLPVQPNTLAPHPPLPPPAVPGS